jgi:hypothetical protein
MDKKSGSGFGIQIRDEQPESYFLELRNHFFGLKHLILGCESGMEKIWIREPGSGMEKSQIRDPGSTSRIRNTAVRIFLADRRYRTSAGSCLTCCLCSVLLIIA